MNITEIDGGKTFPYALSQMGQKSSKATKKQNESWPLLWLDRLPFTIPAAFAAFSIVTMVLLLIGQFRTVLVWPFGLLAASLAAYVVSKKTNVTLPGSPREQRLVGVLALVGIVVWVGYNALYTSQNIFIHRDPSVYANTAVWLKDSNELNVPASDVFGANPNIHPESDDFGSIPETPNRLYPGGLHLLPALLALFARIGGTSFMLHATVLFGGLALLTVYGFARCIAKPRWALLATGILAVSLPMIYFSRDAYSELIDLVFVSGGLSLMWLAQAQKTHDKILWLIAGLAIGATTLSRIDAYLVVAAAIAAVIVLTGFETKPKRSAMMFSSAWFLLGMLISVSVGWLDMTELSARYYHDLRYRAVDQLLLIFFVLAAGLIAIAVAWKTDLLGWLDKNTRRWRKQAVVAAGLIVAVFLATRPFWYVGHGTFHNGLVAGLQNSTGAQIDDTRSYAEWSPYWLAWYIGPVAALIGALGTVLAVRRAVSARKYLYFVPVIFIVCSTALIYLYNPSISPDQIWASRRFLPVVIPGLCVLAAFALDEISKMRIVKNNNTKPWFIVSLVLLFEVAFAAPLFVTYPFLRQREFVPELAQINQVCAALPRRAAVLIVGENGFTLTQPIRTYCQVPAEWVAEPSQKDLEQAREAAVRLHYKPLVLTVSTNAALLPGDAQFTTVSSIVLKQYSLSLDHPPRHMLETSRTFVMGELGVGGAITPLKQ